MKHIGDDNKLLITVWVGLLSIAFAGLVDLTWWFVKIHWLGNQGFLKQTPMLITVYGALWAMYLLPTAWTFAQTGKKRNALNGALLNGDKDKFMGYVDLQISWVTDLLFMVIYGAILLMTFLFESEQEEGLATAFLISAIMMFIRLMCLLRDNPLEGVWLFSPFWKFVRIGIWGLKCPKKDWETEALNRNCP